MCTVVGFAFTALQDVGDWVTYSDHSLPQLGVYVGQGLGFDAVHAGGCLVFALAFGPSLARSVARFARRIDVTWLAPGPAVIPVVVGLALAGWLAGETRSPSAAEAASSPLSYLLAAQNSDGGFGAGPGQASSQLYSGWAALGLAAAGINPQDAGHGGASLASYLASGATTRTDPGSLERTILAARASGESATSFGGVNLVAALQRDIGRNGSVSDQTNWTAFALLSLRAAGASPPGRAVHWLIRQQDSDGGFNSARPAARATSMTRARCWRPWPVFPAIRPAPPARGPSGTSAASRTATGASRPRPEPARTPSPRPGRSRG